MFTTVLVRFAMHKNSLVAFVAAVVAISLAHPAAAQLFGERQLGRTLGRPAPTRFGGLTVSGPATQSIGAVETFGLVPRANSAFVGRDRGPRGRFVGRAPLVDPQAQAGAQAAAELLRRQRAQDLLRRRARDANLLQVQRSAGANTIIYSPRLKIDFENPVTTHGDFQSRLETNVAAILLDRRVDEHSVQVDQGRVTLQGRVQSSYERGLIAAAVNMEPGVTDVVNELTVVGDGSP